MWKTVASDPRYEVSDDGQVRISSSKQILKQRKDRYGYCKVTFNENGIAYKTPTVHRLVAEAFIPNPSGFRCINHKDEDKTNNRIENLEWCSVAYNNTYGSHVRVCGENKKKPVVALLNGEVYKEYPSARDAAAELSIPWRYIGDAIYHRGGRKRAGGFEWRFAKERDENHRPKHKAVNDLESRDS